MTIKVCLKYKFSRNWCLSPTWYNHYSFIVQCPAFADINECATSNGGCSQICTNSVGSFQCSCNSGYRLASDGRTCQDINECTANTDNCQQRCINTAGGFRCECNSGLQLNSDQRTCSGEFSSLLEVRIMASFMSVLQLVITSKHFATFPDINECASSNGGCAQVCTNSVGSFQCSCNSGYTLNGDGRTCSGK